MADRLTSELSPYLLQHADNPVDWYPWGEDALQAAQEQQKPIFLSVGYAACHWCHVMAGESFADPEIARLLNDNFINIKVDREERPDVDAIYMEAVQVLTGHGGWPLSVFLTPEAQPFFGGTYWPRRSAHGMAGFDQVLSAVAEAWQQRRTDVLHQASRLTRFLQENDPSGDPDRPLAERPLRQAEVALAAGFDQQHGGFGPGPKFPQATLLGFLLRRGRQAGGEALMEMALLSLQQMAAGGIHDHLGGGFHRYSLDPAWVIPHFEKMLYDSALLAGCYLDAWQATGRDELAELAGETLDFLLRELRDSSGAFFSAQDAESEGEEGKYYLWTLDELTEALGAQSAELFAKVYDVSEAGNYEGRNILHLAQPLEQHAAALSCSVETLRRQLAESRRKLLATRSRRTRPGVDDKVLVSWNALAVDSLARAGAALQKPEYLQAASQTAEFLLDNLGPNNGLRHYCRQGKARGPAFLDDYAGLSGALITLHETTGRAEWLEAGEQLAGQMLERFADAQGGGFFYTAGEHEPLIARKKDIFDSATPSGNGLAATALLRLSRHTGRQEYAEAAHRTLAALTEPMLQVPLRAVPRDLPGAAPCRTVRCSLRWSFTRRSGRFQAGAFLDSPGPGRAAMCGSFSVRACCDSLSPDYSHGCLH